MNNRNIIIILVVTALTTMSTLIYVQALSVPAIDNSGRKEYVYCPINPSLLDTSTTYELNGCPTVRIYVDRWNSLTPLQQTNIDTQLRSSGFKDPSELVSNVVK